MTTHENVLVKMAKELAIANKIKEHKRRTDNLTKALDYIHEHLNEWYEIYINRMKTESWLQDPYNFIANRCPKWCIYELKQGKTYTYGMYKFKATEYPYPSGQLLEVSVHP